MAVPLGVPMGAAAHVAIPARVRAAVGAVEDARLRVLQTVRTAVKIAVGPIAATAAAVRGSSAAEHRKSLTAFITFWSKHEANKQTSDTANCSE